MADGQAKAVRQHIAGNVGGTIVAAGSGTTDAVADTVELVAHGAVDHNGNAYAAADLLVIAMATSSEASVYQSGAITATHIDIRSSGTAVPYNYIVILKN